MIISMNVSHFVKICQVLKILHQLTCRGVANFGTQCSFYRPDVLPGVKSNVKALNKNTVQWEHYKQHTDRYTYRSRFLVSRVLSMPSIRFVKHCTIAACFSAGNELMISSRSFAKYYNNDDTLPPSLKQRYITPSLMLSCTSSQPLHLFLHYLGKIPTKNWSAKYIRGADERDW